LVTKKRKKKKNEENSRRLLGGHMELIDKYLGEARKKKTVKKKPIPRVKGKGKYFFGIKSNPKGWYQKPEMMGHRWSAETLDSLEQVLNTYSKSKAQKWLIDTVYGTPADLKKIDGENSWHYFNNITKKDIANLQFVLRKVDSMKSDYAALLSMINRKSGMLKDRLTWALEYLAYKHDRERYLEQYKKDFGLYGLQPDEAEERFEKYHKNLFKKIDQLSSKGMLGH
jgi:hypothetical protein